MRVLVGGATGYLGQHLVRALAGQGHQVRALARHADRLGPVRHLVDEIVVADATDPATLAGCCTDIDAVVSAIGLTGRSGRRTPHDVDYAANRNLLTEAGRSGVEVFVYVSVFQPAGLDRVAIVRAKQAFEHELTGSGLRYTILRPNGFFSDLRQFLAMARVGCAVVFGTGAYRINPIDGADVAAAAVSALTRDSAVIELGGPQTLTHRQIARQAFTALGRRPRILAIPVWIPKAVLAALRRLTPVWLHAPAEFVLTVLSHDLIALGTGEYRLAEYLREQAAATPT